MSFFLTEATQQLVIFEVERRVLLPRKIKKKSRLHLDAEFNLGAIERNSNTFQRGFVTTNETPALAHSIFEVLAFKAKTYRGGLRRSIC